MGFLSARTAAGLSQAKVSEKIGVSDAAVSMWETGKTKPRAVLLPKIAALYGCSIDDLLEPNSVEQDQDTTSQVP